MLPSMSFYLNPGRKTTSTSAWAGESIDRIVRGDARRFGKGELREPLFKKGPIRSTVLEGLVFDPQEIFAAFSFPS
ncbi:MAG: hypothetical protein Q8M76_06150 [Spirochaetaceae bacterium]|nr:hypothetical protein [Spirochaetaceae bacterium]